MHAIRFTPREKKDIQVNAGQPTGVNIGFREGAVDSQSIFRRW